MSSRRSHSGSRGSSPSGQRKKTRRQCASCQESAMPDKRLCEKCFSDASGIAPTQFTEFMSWMKNTFNQSMANMVSQVTDNVMRNLDGGSSLGQIAHNPVEQTETQGDTLDRINLPETESEGELSDMESEEEGESEFNTDMIESLVKAVRKTLDLEDKIQNTEKQDKMFKKVSKKNHLFPIHEVIQSTIVGEWEFPDKKQILSRRFKKMFPFATEDTKTWDTPPKVDAAITRVARRTTLPVDEGVSLKDTMERRQDGALKRAYMTGGALCKASVATTSVMRANKIWIQELESAIKSGTEREKLLEMIQDIKMANEYASEASMDSIKLAGKSMGLSVVARRSLWLRHWNADSQSKHNLCSLPFKGNHLFGPELDQIISKASAGKSSFLPQERRDRRFQNKNPRNSLKDAKQYKPGKPFSRQWRPKNQFFSSKRNDQKTPWNNTDKKA
ncbi:lamina-associated polypeptide 2-like [Xenopus laevis]|uniref:Lamina-associated polypeptide 2-like n=1 Tax=Xenopus laevis TaxID=8355 RepID=A0A8J1M6B7_XENLA|nr:lamina-associated polypeptide 2-like [Xenopus laevis]